MNAPDISIAAAILVLLLGVLLSIIATQFQAVEPTGLDRGFRRRSIAIEFALNFEEVRKILGLHNRRNRTVMRQLQVADFFFIFAWTSLFVSVVVTLGSHSRIIAIATIFCVLAAAWYDVQENRAILAVLPRPLDASVNPFVVKWRIAAYFKWVLLLVGMILLSLLFFDCGPGWFRAAGVMLALTGVSGLVALCFSPTVFERVADILPGPAVIVMLFAFSFDGWSLRSLVAVVPTILVVLMMLSLRSGSEEQSRRPAGRKIIQGRDPGRPS